MQFSSSFVLAALPFLVLARPQLAKRADNSTMAYTMMAVHSGDEAVHNQPINANNEGFWIGVPPSSACPDGVTCPAGTDTSVTLDAGWLALNVVVPGGQEVFVKANSLLAYNAPHAHGIESGATSIGFATDAPTTGGIMANLMINDIGASGWLACPSVGADGVSAYQIAANTTAVRDGWGRTLHCHDIAIAMVPESNAGPSAFQYQ